MVGADASDCILRGSIEGFRWHGISAFLRRTAMRYGLDIDLSEERGLFSTTVFYKVTGSRQRLEEFKVAVRRTLDAYNEATNNPV